MGVQCKGMSRNGRPCRNMAIDGNEYCRQHQPEPEKRPSTGVAFEERVLEVLRLLGYTAERNVTRHGCQIDLYAEYRTGRIRHRLMVECKDYGTQTVGVPELLPFVGALSIARGREVDKGLFVTRQGFTRQAKELGEAAGVELLTYSELSTQLVDFGPYIQQLLGTFRNHVAYKHYVSLSACDVEEFDLAEPSQIHRPLEAYLDRCLFEKNLSRIALLGNFGTGKSTFCQKYAFELARRYDRIDPSSRVPVVLSLTDYDSKGNLQRLVTETLCDQYGIRGLDQGLCLELQRQGRFVFLIDGFDEMASRVDSETIRDNIRELTKLCRVSGNKVVLTCRTHFFRDSIEAEDLEEFNIVYIPEWGETELLEYLQKRFGQDWKAKLKQVEDTHNLIELAQTPLFLEMIATTLPQLGDEVRVVDLYKEYTSRWIRAESRRRVARLTWQDRERFVQELAIRLFRDDRASCHYSEFAEMLKGRFGTSAAQDDYLQSDVQTCAFLTRDAHGYYGFRHKSFMEYFVATVLAGNVRDGKSDVFSIRVLPLEVRRIFLSKLLHDDPPISTLKDWARTRESSPLRQNALGILTDLKVDLSDVRLESDSRNEYDAQLIASFLKGDADAWDTLIKRYQPDVTKTVRRYVDDPSAAQDISQEVFVRLMTRRDRLTDITNFRKWLRDITLATIRDARPNRTLRLLPDVPDFSGETVNDSSELAAEVVKKMYSLPDRERFVIRARYFEDLTLREIAKRCGTSEKVVQNLLYRGLQRLRREIKEGD